MEKIIREWLKVERSSGYGSGDGSGYGYGDGSGDGSGSGSGYGDVDGYGYGYGYGYGGLAFINGFHVWLVDGIATVITKIKESVAKGFILESDLSMHSCYIVKGNGYFAHGKTIREAQEALRAKIFEDLEPEETIEKFMEEFKPNEKYKGLEFFEWHHYLTGSCLMGRESFVRSHNLNLEDEFTVDEFINLCIDDYGGEIIRQLKEAWEEEYDGS